MIIEMILKFPAHRLEKIEEAQSKREDMRVRTAFVDSLLKNTEPISRIISQVPPKAGLVGFHSFQISPLPRH